MADIESWKLGLPILGAIILSIQNLLLLYFIIRALFQGGSLQDFYFVYNLDLIGFSILGVGCFLLSIRHHRIINPLVAGVAFFSWIGFILLWRLINNNMAPYFWADEPPDLIIALFFFLGAISLVIAFFFYWRSLSEYEGGRLNLIGLIVSMIYTIANLLIAILVLIASLFTELGMLEPSIAFAMVFFLLSIKFLVNPILGLLNFAVVLFALIITLKR
ncbi:MAG: hypothetical protein ACFFDI_15015 [Promethearchaeota archaeon]